MERNSTTTTPGENGVGDGLHANSGRWSFDGETPQAFEEHARRSIPLYDEGHRVIANLSDFFTPNPARVVELGCASGRLLRTLADHHHDRTDIQWVGVDNSPAMIEEAQCKAEGRPIEWICDDINSFELGQNDMVIAHYTVQFVRPRLRQELFHRIYASLNWGGALVLFEKVRGPDARFQDITTALYQDFKLQAGFKPEEILNKSRSLKGVLEPFSTSGNLDLMHRAGFEDVTTVMKMLCFEGFLAIK